MKIYNEEIKIRQLNYYKKFFTFGDDAEKKNFSALLLKNTYLEG